MAGVEETRYCWTRPVKSGRANPLVLPTLRELMKHHGDKREVGKYGRRILEELKQAD